MKSTLAFLIMFILLSIVSFSQIPQSFKYQAVIRDNLGNLLVNNNITVKTSILEDSQSGTIVFSENHAVQTNANGLISLQIGEGTVNSGSFSGVDWSNHKHFIKIEVDESNSGSFISLGSFELLSVPYALYAHSAGTSDSMWETGGDNIFYNNGNVGVGSSAPFSRLEVKESATNTGNPLFEVINANNDTVFAVFADGVKIYVDASVKGKVGGFAVSGRSPGKTTGEPYLLVTPDSTRVYVNESAKGKVGGFAVSGRSPGKAGASTFLDLTPDNYFIGHEAGINTTTGLYNSFIGYQSGYSNTEGNYNVFLGRQTGYFNTTGSENIFVGDITGANNTTGYANVFVGDGSGYLNNDGYWNIFLGRSSGYSNTSGSANIIIGDYAGYDNTSGYDNVMVGDYAGASNTEGSENIFIGKETGWSNYDGEKNVFVGAFSGYSNISGISNVFIGDSAGYYNSTGVSNVFLGQSAGKSNTGHYNVFVGTSSGASNTQGTQNLFLGQQAGEYSSTGNYNTYVGVLAGGGNNVNGHENVFIGYGAGYYETGSNKLYIDNDGNDFSNALIYGDFQSSELRFNANVGIWSAPSATYALYLNGDLWATTYSKSSDKRWKTNIYDLQNSLELVKKLRGVSFNWKVNEFPEKRFENGTRAGFIAQEVEEILPDLVKADDKGFKSVEYTEIIPYLVESIKEQQKMIDDQKKIIGRLEKNNEMLKRDFNMLKSKVDKLLNKNTQTRTATPSFEN